MKFTEEKLEIHGGQVGGQDGGHLKNLTIKQKEVLYLIIANPENR